MSVATLCALAAIALWGGLAWLGVRLAAVPPFLLVGSALTIVGVLALPTYRRWRVPPIVMALGIYGLFGFHFFLFIALRLAPPLPANLVNYLWPLFIVLFAPLFVGSRLTRWHIAGAVLGFAGAILAISNGRVPSFEASAASDHPNAAWGYAAALTSAVIWATYSLMGQRLRRAGTDYPTAAIGAFCLVSGLLALACHAVLEPAYTFASTDWLPLAVMAIGPMGAAFFLWDVASRAAMRARSAPSPTSRRSCRRCCWDSTIRPASDGRSSSRSSSWSAARCSDRGARRPDVRRVRPTGRGRRRR